jgi:hypothetical protein
MKLSQTINRWLAPFDIAVARRSTLDHLHSALTIKRNAHDVALEKLNFDIAALAEQSLAFRDEIIRHQIASKWSLVDTLESHRMNENATRTCPLCDYSGVEAEYKRYESSCIFGGGILIRRQCPQCEVIFGADKMFRLSDTELSQDYEWHYRVYAEGDSTEQEIRAFQSLGPKQEGTYLNYGAGSWSRSTQILRQKGWNVFAYEPHSSAADNAPYVITDAKVLSTMEFDGIFSNNVLEHLRHPVSNLRFISTLLKPNALMAHATPCFEYLYEYTRFHLFFYTGRSKTVLSNKVGLIIEEHVVDGEFMNLVCRRAVV